MKLRTIRPLLAALTLASASMPMLAQPVAASEPSRAEVKAQRDEFLRTHVWNAESEVWTLKPGIAPPVGVKSRAEVKAERDEFLRHNRWDVASESWVPLEAAPRDLGKMTRAQVRAETAAFMRTHRFDETKEAWVEVPVRKK